MGLGSTIETSLFHGVGCIYVFVIKNCEIINTNKHLQEKRLIEILTLIYHIEITNSSFTDIALR